MSKNIELSINGSDIGTFIKKSIDDKIKVSIESLDDDIIYKNNKFNEDTLSEIQNTMKNICNNNIPLLVSTTFKKNLSDQVKESYKKLLDKYNQLTENTIETETRKILLDFTENKSNDIIISKFCEKITDKSLEKNHNSLKSLKCCLNRNEATLESVRNENKMTRVALCATSIVCTMMCYIFVNTC